MSFYLSEVQLLSPEQEVGVWKAGNLELCLADWSLLAGWQAGIPSCTPAEHRLGAPNCGRNMINRNRTSECVLANRRLAPRAPKAGISQGTAHTGLG